MLNLKMNESGSVLNDPSNYSAIAKILRAGMSCFFSYASPKGDYDVFLKYRVDFGNGGYQRGIRQTDLFVGVLGIGFYAFELKDSATEAACYDEKFGAYLGQEFYTFLDGIQEDLYRSL